MHSTSLAQLLLTTLFAATSVSGWCYQYHLAADCCYKSEKAMNRQEGTSRAVPGGTLCEQATLITCGADCCSPLARWGTGCPR